MEKERGEGRSGVGSSKKKREGGELAKKEEGQTTNH